MDNRVTRNTALLKSAMAGLSKPQKTLESKWFYDQAGSELFEKITDLPEYYLTRTEKAILQAGIVPLRRHIPAGTTLVELGSGASVKTRILLDGLPGLKAYLPIDISASFLFSTADALAHDYPDLFIDPVVADFLGDVRLPPAHAGNPKAAFFPGSTLGNLDDRAATSLLSRIRGWDQVNAFVIGIDLVKDTDTLISAYDDAAGVTAAFNCNLLHRLNRETGAHFDVDSFRHEARWNSEKARIEMHLVSRSDQTVLIGTDQVHFAAGESIHTENSRKYTRESFSRIAAEGGWSIAEFLTDANALFAVAVLVPSISERG